MKIHFLQVQLNILKASAFSILNNWLVKISIWFQNFHGFYDGWFCSKYFCFDIFASSRVDVPGEISNILRMIKREFRGIHGTIWECLCILTNNIDFEIHLSHSEIHNIWNTKKTSSYSYARTAESSAPARNEIRLATLPRIVRRRLGLSWSIYW